MQKLALLVIAFLLNTAHASPAEKLSDCVDVVKKCTAKGYLEQQHATGKGLWADCVGKRSRDQKVEGVEDVTAEAAKKCLAAVKSQFRGHGH